MPRTLTTATEAHRLRADAGWVRLLKLVLYRDRFGASPGSLTIYASDATRYLPIFGGGTREYLPLVLTWGGIGDSLASGNVDTAPGSLSLTLSDTVPIAAGGSTFSQITALLREGENTTGYDKAEGDVTFSWLPPGGFVGTGGDEIVWYQGRVDTFDEAA